MRPRILLTACAAAVLAVPAAVRAQDPGQGVEVLTRGPVHEAYATTAEFPVAGPVVPKPPPDPVEELPPDQKPAGDDVQWIPGYWAWDEERTDFVWVSGFWRVPPPGRVWVPGHWQPVQGGFQWVQGFWHDPDADAAQQAQTVIEYLPPPPQPLELAPSIPAPGDMSFYVPGSWVWRNRYVWRPGFWMDVRPGWVWVPAHFRWTPLGYVFVDGYWDYPLENRGVLFAPVAFQRAVIAQPAFAYTPAYAVSSTSLFTSLFVRRGFGVYYFGDYFEPRYATAGFSPWAGVVQGTTFSLITQPRRGVHYDPLWDYYRAATRANPQFVNTVAQVYEGRYQGTIPRPPRTLAQQNTVISTITNNTTNVTNTVVNKTTLINNVTMVAPVAQVAKTNPAIKLEQVQPHVRERERDLARQLRDVAAARRQQEAQLATEAPARPTPGQPSTPAAQPVQVRLNVPVQAVAQAQAATRPDQPHRAPPPPPKQAEQERRPNRGPAQPGAVNPAQPPHPGAILAPQPPAPKEPKKEPKPPSPAPQPPTQPAPAQPAPQPQHPAPAPKPPAPPQPKAPGAPTPQPQQTPPGLPHPQPQPVPIHPAPIPPQPLKLPQPASQQPTHPAHEMPPQGMNPAPQGPHPLPHPRPAGQPQQPQTPPPAAPQPALHQLPAVNPPRLPWMSSPPSPVHPPQAAHPQPPAQPKPPAAQPPAHPQPQPPAPAPSKNPDEKKDKKGS